MNGGTTFFTSDHHFLHELVAKSRGFSCSQEHDDWVIEGYRNVVTDKDRVFFVGDLTGGGAQVTEAALEIVAELPGEKHFVTGNHDETHPSNPKAIRRQRRWLEVFESVNPFVELRVIIGERRRHLSISHFPYFGDGAHADEDRFSQWRLKQSDSWLLHGHTHRARQQRHDGRQIHIGLDAWHAPVSLDTITRIITNYEKETETEA